MTGPRLIEAAFPLKQVSLDSVHEKNVRHGHVSTLHIWPARRPLAACRAALLATLLPDPGDRDGRRRLLERMAGRVVEAPDAGGGHMKEETRGGVCRWGREADGEIEAFRAEIRASFGGRAPRVLDPFAGGGAIPLEAMRLGCEAVAADVNPVAWFILRCTLHYPRLVAGHTRPLPAFALRDRAFMEAFLKARGVTRPVALREEMARYGHEAGEAPPLLETPSPDSCAAFAWHLRAWGRRALAGARRAVAARYPTYAEFEQLRRKGRGRRMKQSQARYRPQPPRLLEPDENGEVSTAALNAGFDSLYLEDESKPRWIAKPTVACLWARTVRCNGCRAEIPLLKTRWLCRTARKRVLLTMAPRDDGAGVDFGVERDAPEGGGDAARKRAHDRALGAGTMSGSGAGCPCCGAVATTADIRAEGRAGRLGARMTAVVVEGQQGKEYRLPTEAEIAAAQVGREELEELYDEIPFGFPEEPMPSKKALGIRAPLYGFDKWSKLFTGRQLLALGTFVRELRRCAGEMEDCPAEWREALIACLAPSISRVADRGSSLTTWTNDRETLGHTFARFALPIVWDFAESCPLADTTGGFVQAVEWVARVLEHLQDAAADAPEAQTIRRSAIEAPPGQFDAIVTDPPYYDAIPYSDLMDFFHIWLRRALHGLSSETDDAFAAPLGPKWESGDGELIDDASRFGGDRQASKRAYEDGMARAFGACLDALREDGRLVVVFANKSPDAWETLVSALIRAGFAVTGSWPIQTEMQNKVAGGARLSSSIWLVCRKRPQTARPGWDARVLAEMQENIAQRLRDFWDAGIRGPDFVWAATGPALEAFSRHPAVRKADEPGALLTVAGFLREVRRMVVGFVVSRLLRRDEGATDELDDPTTYYLLHRNDFGLGPAPAGACILYALSCNLSDSDLAGRLDLLARGGGGETDEESASGGEARLKPWHRRHARDLGEPAADGAPPPLIDRVHRTMQLWKAGEQSRVDAYLEARGLWRHELFARLIQALIELAANGSEERAMLESIQNHLRAGGGPPAPQANLLI